MEVLKNVKNLIGFDDKGNIDEIKEVTEIVKIEKRHFKKGEFFMVSFEFEKLLLEKNYGVIELKVLVALKCRLDFNNRIRQFTQKDIAQEIKSSQPNVSKALKRLEEDQIIYRDGLEYYFSDSYIKGAGNKKQNKRYCN